MISKAEDLFKNKIRLIYEYNNKSPLFAHIANWEMENNNFDSAIGILEHGLKKYPEFPTPYFLLGKVYCKLDDFDKALKCYKKGSELLHSRETYHFYLREIESLKKLKSPPGLHTVKFPEEQKEKIVSKESSEFEDNLDDLAQRISRAKIPGFEEKNPSRYIPVENSESSLIVSETLAKIYVAQGEIEEAIAVYEKLGRKDPSKEEYFSQKISELRSKL